jgi:hypothetical protein
MELLLNLSWLVIALAAIFILRSHWRRSEGPTLREWVALGTFLFLLFPVISLSDDLHPEIALAEAVTGSKHFHLLSAHGPDSQPHTSYSPGMRAIVFRNRILAVPPKSSAKIIELGTSNALSARSKVLSGRSPPSILL